MFAVAYTFFYVSTKKKLFPFPVVLFHLLAPHDFIWLVQFFCLVNLSLFMIIMRLRSFQLPPLSSIYSTIYDSRIICIFLKSLIELLASGIFEHSMLESVLVSSHRLKMPMESCSTPAKRTISICRKIGYINACDEVQTRNIKHISTRVK